MSTALRADCKIIAVANQKGGVAKSALAVNLSAGLAARGKRVLLIDLDSQGDATASCGIKNQDDLELTTASVFNLLIRDEEVENCFGKIKIEDMSFDLLPANIELASIEMSLVNTLSRERKLSEYVYNQRKNYDFIIIDCCPSLGMLTINALATANSVIIPVQPAYLPVKGLQQLFKTIFKVQKQINPELYIEGVVMSMVDNRSNYTKDICRLLRDSYGENIKIFNIQIPASVKVAEATAEGKSIYMHDPKGKAAAAFNILTEEVLANE